ncbi:hypothetical protein GCM10009789_03960 [Kribbella sancticallisti]|uniref:Uncharacterized protein n=1 Tax=Kribbella sancticallisti TaxID=460087 RepID=A0ABN2CC44_9ACTN
MQPDLLGQPPAGGGDSHDRAHEQRSEGGEIAGAAESEEYPDNDEREPAEPETGPDTGPQIRCHNPHIPKYLHDYSSLTQNHVRW